MAKVLCVLFDGPVDGSPTSYARDEIPAIAGYHNGQTAPTPDRIEFQPGQLLGSVFGELGLRRSLEERGQAFVVGRGGHARQLLAARGRRGRACGLAAWL